MLLQSSLAHVMSESGGGTVCYIYGNSAVCILIDVYISLFLLYDNAIKSRIPSKCSYFGPEDKRSVSVLVHIA